MGKYGIGARVRDIEGDHGTVVAKRKGERQVEYDNPVFGTVWWSKSDLTVLPAANDDSTAAAEQGQGEEPKFKVGDRVRNIGERSYESFPIDTCGVITGCIGQHGFDVRSEETGWEGHFFRPEITCAPAATPEWQPKVGDRVRFNEEYCGTPRGAIGEVVDAEPTAESTNGYLLSVRIDGGELKFVFSRRLEPLPVAAEAQGATTDKWGPEVGQRVRCIDNLGPSSFRVGEVYTIKKVYPTESENADFLIYVEEIESAMFDFRFEPAPLTIEAGKFYRTRDGRKVGPIKKGNGWQRDWESLGNEFEPDFLTAWCKDGRFYEGKEHKNDLIAEWTTDEPNTPRKIKAGDKLVCIQGYSDTIKEGQIYTASRDERAGFGGLMYVDVNGQVGLRTTRFRHATAEDLAATHKFKVGDRVRVGNVKNATVATRNSEGLMSLKYDSGETGLEWWRDDELELATIAAGSLVTLASPLVVHYIDGDDAYFDHGALPLSALVLA